MKHCLLLILIFTIISCDDTQELFFDDVNGGLTVEAYIKPNEHPRVYLTTGLSVNGFSDTEFLSAIESTAKVEIFNDDEHEIAIFSKDNSRFPSRYYGFLDIEGETGKTYNLKITISNAVYTAKTTVPNLPNVISTTVVKNSTFENGTYNLQINLENPSEDSYYKFYLKKTEDSYFNKAEPFVASNEVINSPEISVFIDYLHYDEENNKSSLLEKGYSYDLKVVVIDRYEYLFWKRALSTQAELINFPSLVQELPSNISNNAFGFFSGNHETIITFSINQ